MASDSIQIPTELAVNLRRLLEGIEGLHLCDQRSCGADESVPCLSRDLRGDLETFLFRQARQILSLHIPKTGGVSFRQMLARLYGDGFCQTYWEITDANGRVLPDFPATVSCIHGHFYAEKLHARFPAAALVTWVRDPVERVASYFHYWQREPDWKNPLCRALHEHEWTLREFANRPEMQNEMSRYFGCIPPHDFAFIGLTDRYAESMELFLHLFNLTAVPTARQNVNPLRRDERYEIADDVRAEIVALNAVDIALYRECVTWFDERSAEIAGRSLGASDSGENPSLQA